MTVYIPVQSVSAAEAQTADSAGVYVFQDAKKEGTVTVIKKWKDGRTNDERPVPDITISTESPEGAITFFQSDIAIVIRFHMAPANIDVLVYCLDFFFRTRIFSPGYILFHEQRELFVFPPSPR